jgi:hypothetical protein
MPEILDWTKPGSFSAGRDPLGFQAASVRLYTALVPGLTNVTNRLRYYSFYCWVLWQFEQIYHTTKEKKWIEFIRRAEAAIALACQVGDAASARGMAGSDWAGIEAADRSKQSFDLETPTNRPGENGQYLKAKYGNFGQFYTASMLEMKLIDVVDRKSPRVFGVLENDGKLLAKAVQSENAAACDLLLKAIARGRISRTDCQVISDALHPSFLDPASEEGRLLKRFLQGERTDDSTAAPRRTSLRNLLTVVSEAEEDLQLRRALYVQGGSLRQADHAISNLTLWRAYFVNEFCHIALEVWLNALVAMANAAAEPSLVDDLVGALASTASAERDISISDIASKLAFASMEAEHELGSELQGIASGGGEPDKAAIQGSTRLIFSLWHRWGNDAEVRHELASKTADGRSAEGVFRFLDGVADTDARSGISGLIKKFIVSNHLMIAGQKLATGGRFTYRFTLDDGCLVDGEFGQYTYTTPRIFNLLTFAEDAGLIDVATAVLTPAGMEFLRAA